MEIVKLPIEKLNPAPYNPRIDLKPGDKDYEKLKKSILAFGYIDPIIVNKRGYVVVGGHQRLKILQEMGHKTVEVSLVDLPPDQEKALNIALNKTGGDWDIPKLQDLLAELQETGMDLEVTGYDDLEIEELMRVALDDGEPRDNKKQVTEDNFDPEEEAARIKIPKTKPGDIWLLGRHRLFCGDATKTEDVRRLMDGKQAAMVFTDPPYNVDYTGATEDKLKIRNDKMADADFYSFLLKSYKNMFDAVAPGGAIYVCHADTEGLNFRKAMLDAGWLLKQCIIWVKSSMVMGRQDYHWQHEPILYGWKPGAAHIWNGDRRQTTVIDHFAGITAAPDGKGVTLTFASGVETVVIRVPIYEVIKKHDDATTSVWRFEKPTRNADHPTMKPVGIPARAINNSSRTGDIVLDLFGGSGSTLIAAEQTGRTCYTMELDQIYADVIVSRYIAQVGGDKDVFLLRDNVRIAYRKIIADDRQKSA
jgi:DNA modification methylase